MPLERQTAKTIGPFFRFGDPPDQQNFFNGLRDCHGSRYQNQTRRLVSSDELSEMPRHRPHVMRYENTVERCGERENVGVLHTLGDETLGQFKVDFGLTSNDARNDILIEVSVSEEPDPQHYLCRLLSRSRLSFLDRLSGSGDWLAPNSCDKC